MTHEKKVVFPDDFMMISDEKERKSWKTSILLDFCVWNHIKFSFNGKKVKITMVNHSIKYIYIAEYDDKIEKFRVSHGQEFDWKNDKDVYNEDFTLGEFEIELAKKLS